MLGHGWCACFHFCLIFLMATLYGCGQSAEIEAGNRILEANLFLSQGKCTEALNTLTEVESSKRDYYFYQSYSSAYACFANYKEIEYVENLSNLDSSAFFKSMASFSTSRETDPTSAGFEKLKEAIRTILYIPASTGRLNSDRVSLYGLTKGEDLSIQVALQIMSHLGKFLYHYGNTSTAGVKGGGSATSKCFINYTTANAQTYHANNLASLGACDGVAKGHADLATGSATKFTRLCDFIVHLNHAIDIFGNITFPNDGRFDSISDVSASIDTAIALAEASLTAGTLTSLLGFYDYDSCVTYASNATNLENVELYFLSIVERGLQ